MPLTKSRTSVNSNTTMTAGAGDVTSSAQDLTGSYSTVVDIKITNGATGPTIAGQVQLQIGADSTGIVMVNYGGPLVAALGNSVISSWSIELPTAAGCFKIVSGSNTAQSCTLDCDYSRITGI